MYKFILRWDTKIKICIFMMISKLENKCLHGNEICDNKCETRIKIDWCTYIILWYVIFIINWSIKNNSRIFIYKLDLFRIDIISTCIIDVTGTSGTGTCQNFLNSNSEYIWIVLAIAIRWLINSYFLANLRFHSVTCIEYPLQK